MSDATDQAEFRRKKIVEYDTLLGDIELSYNDYGENQKEKIKRLAKILDESGHPKENICAKVCKDVAPFGIKDRYVRTILPDEFKDKSKIRDQVCGSTTANTDQEESEQQQKHAPLLVTTNGETVDPHEAESAAELDEIYGGKSLNQMKKEAAREVNEDKEETLENPKNRVPLLTDIPPDVKQILAEYESMKLTMNQLVEDRDTAIKNESIMSSKFNKLRGGVLEDELRRLKVENNNLHTLLSDVDKNSLAKEGYKEIEVLKMEPGTTRLLNEISNKSQRTFFLLVHPKTMQIKGARTDVQQHQIEAKRAAGVL